MTPPVVVGVDAAGTADDAVQWATAEAAARRSPLRLVHAFRHPPPADSSRCTGAELAAARAVADLVLHDAVALARRVDADVDVSVRPLPGPATRALLLEATGAGLLVLGSRGLCGLRCLVTRSVSVHVAAHAPCPVVVVHPAGPTEPRHGSPRVVVGVEATAAAQPAVGFAFAAARQRGVPLLAVHAWSPDVPADFEAVCGSPAVAEASARAAVEEALDRWRPEFPDVPVLTTVVRADPARALVEESTGAALVVVGSRSHGNVVGAVFGSVGHTVLHRAHSATAVVHRDGAVRRRPAPPSRLGH